MQLLRLDSACSSALIVVHSVGRVKKVGARPFFLDTLLVIIKSLFFPSLYKINNYRHILDKFFIKIRFSQPLHILL